MTNINRITLLGNTGNEPKTASTANGKPVTRLSIATNKRYQDARGEWQSHPVWHQVLVFGDNATYAANIKPGSLVFVEGEMRYREYDRELNTDKGSVIVAWPVAEIIASSITAISTKNAVNQHKGGKEHA
jgi:single-strand DNA-binding protein